MASSSTEYETAQHGNSPNFASWATAASCIATPIFLWLFQGPKGFFPRWAVLFPIALAAASLSWAYIVSAFVPEPYLDEVFHIPQAQKYCEGRFQEWDDKITTPPGLYLISLLVPGVIKSSPSLGTYVCDVQSLRLASVVALLILAVLALCCRGEIEARLYEAHSSTRPKGYTQYARHTAFNIALFPLLFFFSGLYYTDVASTAVVLGGYLNHLRRLGRDRSSFFSDLVAISLGVLALFMRQTNVFWFVVYMGGLEAVHAIKTLRPERVAQPYMTTIFAQLKYYAWRYSVGDVHDPPLHMIWPDVSLGVAAICNPFHVVRQIWPYIAVLLSFVSFVAWNGGVVLGDKSNHIATIHVAQMLYIWPFFAFFSLPLLLPYALPFINIARRFMNVKMAKPSVSYDNEPSEKRGSARKQKRTEEARARDKAAQGPSDLQPPPPLSKSLNLIAAIFDSKMLWPVYLVATIVLSILVVRYNTIVHPFTLADNRHYMFYIFRYTIRRSALIRYLLIIPYTFSRWMTWGTMAGCSEWLFISHGNHCSAYYHRSRPAPFTSHPFWINRSQLMQTNAAFPVTVPPVSPDIGATQQVELQQVLDKDPLLLSSEPASTSTGLILLLATTLSLITAPLVEPRYFIIPWVMWRLLVPAWRLHDHEHLDSFIQSLKRNAHLAKVIRFFECYDLRLVLETVWFVAINVATGYLFLFKPYLWRAEDGRLLDEGRLQRFMW
ncbi:hypothetical protein G7046_g8477 [Stylonectria norvegica]|nr:hypothetical protein G7046_g8477 [Stylonectria norvegica]